MKRLIYSLYISLCLSLVVSKITIDVSRQLFVDEDGRARLYHGVNVIYKTAPFYPSDDTFHPAFSLVDEDIQNLLRWGFKMIRLHVPWEGVEPIRGQYDYKYLSKIEEIIQRCQRLGMYVMLDSHQDLLNKQFCGEGFPDWAVVKGETFPAPLPIELPKDEKGYPVLEECLKHDFFAFYWTKDITKSFQRLYNNEDGLADAFGRFWAEVAKVTQKYDNLLGYNLLNEPFNGDLFTEPDLDKGQGINDYRNLEKFHDIVNKRIREVDDKGIIFFEPTVTDRVFEAFTKPPGGAQYRDRSAIGYHSYCEVTDENFDPTNMDICGFRYDHTSRQKVYGAARIRVAAMLNEFGAVRNTEKGRASLRYVTARADKEFHSWAYWSFKYYNDITTLMKPQTESSFYNQDSTLQTEKVKSLAKTYLTAVCGDPIDSDFNFTESYFYAKIKVTNNQSCNDKYTEVFASQEFYYPNGLDFNFVNCETDCSVETISPNYYRILHKVKENRIIEFSITPKKLL